jgi:glycosyltransferase involved in cell wall biosynthesis
MPVTVTVSMPFWRCHAWLRRSVDAVLGQTYRDIRLVVVNDADPVSPWPLLADINDPRLVRFDLPENRGRYFIDAVIFEATRPELWAMQDPDDWPEPDRFAKLAPLACDIGAAFAPTLEARNGGPERLMTQRLHGKPYRRRLEHHVGYGSGVIAGARIAQVGGFHPDLRLGYDTYLMNAAKLWPFMAIDTPLQHKARRPDSLTTAPATGFRSKYRAEVRARLDGLWRRAWDRFVQGREIASVITGDVLPETRAEVSYHAQRLEALL